MAKIIARHEEIPHARHMQVRAEASANGGSTHGASGQAAKAGSRCSGPAKALKGQAPQHRAPGVALREVEPGQAMSRAHRGRSPPARQRHQVHAGTHGAHGQGRGDTRISCARWDGSGQGQDHNVQTHAVDGGAKEEIREALIALSDSAALRLIGARLRPERSHRQLPKELQAMIQDAEL